MKFYFTLISILWIVWIFSCKNQSINSTPLPVAHSDSVRKSCGEVKYAKGFSLSYTNNHKVINIQNFDASRSQFKYILYQKDSIDSLISVISDENTKFIKIPITSIVCLSTTHLAFIEFIDEIESIKGISYKKYVYSPKINRLINEGRIIDVGIEQNLNIEAILELKPEVVMVYGVEGISTHNYKKLEEQGLNVIYCSEYLEETPLGKAEWVKFFAAFYNKEQLVNQKFEQIADDYNRYKMLVNSSWAVQNKPTVILNMALEGLWFVPAENSFMARFFKDAGAIICLAPSGAKSSLSFSFEAVLDKCNNADFWLHTGTANSLKDILNADKRYANFSAFKRGNVYNNNNRVNADGGNDYWESGVVYPNIILKDLIKIFHPEIISDYELYYYKKLNY